jgi:hypothetical protein
MPAFRSDARAAVPLDLDICVSNANVMFSPSVATACLTPLS